MASLAIILSGSLTEYPRLRAGDFHNSALLYPTLPTPCWWCSCFAMPFAFIVLSSEARNEEARMLPAAPFQPAGSLYLMNEHLNMHILAPPRVAS